MIVLGVDASTVSTGAVVLEGTHAHAAVTLHPRKDKSKWDLGVHGAHAFGVFNGFLRDHMAGLMAHGRGPDLVVLEGVPYGGFPLASIALAQVQGVFVASLASMFGDVRVVQVMPTAWKKRVLGSGRADKQASIDAANSYASEATWTHDSADALHLARYGVYLLNTEDKQTGASNDN